MRSPFPLMNASAGLLVLGLLTAALPLRTAGGAPGGGRRGHNSGPPPVGVAARPGAPQEKGITCHLVDFDRSLIDRLSKGNWFEDPSNASIACRQTGPVTVGDIELSQKGEEVFSERKSLIFKSIAIRRIYDRPNDTLVYVVYSRQVKDASAKTSISTVPLFSANATWTKGKPAAK